MGRDLASVADGLVGTGISSTVVKGRGIRLICEDGTEYLDAVSGTFNIPLGYDHPAVVNAVSRQLQQLSHLSSSLSGPYADKTLSTLVEIAPDNIDSGWLRDITGSTANECAIKIAQKHEGKSDIVSLHLSHHGQTVFTTSISGNAFRRRSFSGISNPHSIKVPAPYCYRCPYNKTYPGCGLLCVEAIYDHIEFGSSGNVACIIIEPILGNGGNIVPPPGYFEALGKLCEETGMLLIADEVQTGMGRTGEMFACDAMNIPANIITLAKGLGGIGIPVAAVLMESRLNKLEQFEHSFTSGGNLLSLAAADATIDVIREKLFLKKVQQNGRLLETLLQPLQYQYQCVGDVRGVGMMWGVEIVDQDQAPAPEKAKEIIKCAESKYRLILRPSRYGFGNVIKVRPALIASHDDLHEIVDKLSNAINDVDPR